MTPFRHVLSLNPIDYRLKVAQRMEATLQRLTLRTNIANLLRVASNSPLGCSNDTLASIAPYSTYCPARELFRVAERNTEGRVAFCGLSRDGSDRSESGYLSNIPGVSTI